MPRRTRPNKIPPAHVRRMSVKPPIGVSRSYARLVNEWLTRFQEWALEFVCSDWHTNTVHNPGHVPKSREDAIQSRFITTKIAGLKLALEQRFSPKQALAAGITTLAQRVERNGREEFTRVIGIPTKSLGITGGQIEGWRDTNVKLISSLAGRQIEEIRGMLATAEATGLRVEELRSEIQSRFGVTKAKADLLARDQVLKLNGQLNKERMGRAGITKYIWTTSRDERVRGNPDGLYPPEKTAGRHFQLDGTVQDWSSAPQVSTDGRREHPGGDYQCRCTAYPILPELEGEDESDVDEDQTSG